MSNKAYSPARKRSKKESLNPSKETIIPKLQNVFELNLNSMNIKESNISPKNKNNIHQKERTISHILLDNDKKQNINKTEVKDKKKKNCNSQISFNNLMGEETNKSQKNKKIIIKDKETANNINNTNKNYKKLNSENLKKNTKNIQNKNLDKIILQETDDNNDIESMEENINFSRNKVIKSMNVNINMNLNDINKIKLNEDNIDNNNQNNRENYKRTLTGSKKEQKEKEKVKEKNNSNNNDKLIKNQSEENIQKKVKTKMEDILIVNNEFDNSKMIQSNNIHKTKFLTLSSNPFTTKIKKKSSILNMNTNKYIKNINNNKLDLVQHIKSQTSSGLNELFQSNQTSNIFGDSSVMDSSQKASLNTNITEITDNPNLEPIYRKFLLQAKIGDKVTFLDIFRQIYTLQKEYININYTDENGNTALHYACDEGNLKIVEILIQANCDTNIKNNNKQTPLHLSTKRGYFDISKMLIESGAILNIYDSEKNSPLHYICKNNYVELLRYILTKNPKINQKNIYGKTPKDLTTNIEIKNLLDEYSIKFENKSKDNKINIESVTPKTKMAKDEINNLQNDNMIRNRANTLLQPNAKYILHHNNKNNNNSLYEKLETESKTEKTNSKNLKYDIDLNDNKRSQSPNIHQKKNMNSILKKDEKAKKEKTDDSNIYFHNTNNINNNSININIYSIEGRKHSHKGSHNINKKNSKSRGFITIDEPRLNNSNNNIEKSATYISKKLDNNFSRGKTINVGGSKLVQKSKFYSNKADNILDVNDSYEKNFINFNKTEDNINSNDTKLKKIKKSNINKKFQININNSANLNNISGYLKYKGLSNNSSNCIQSTEQILTKTKQTLPKKKESKFKPIKNIDNSLINNINMSKIEAIKHRSNIISAKVIKKLNTTSTQEHVTPSSFVCLAQLGKGSFGEVYLVQKIDSSEQYAMKVLRKERIMGQNLLKYAIAERNVLSGSNHPFIVKLSYAFQTSTKLFLVLEYCPNGDLAKHLVFEKRFKEPRAKFYICEVLLALENLHKRDIIFRDLKPDNVVLDKEGHCKLTDFGLSKEGVTDNAYAQSFCGSIAYLAPEMLKKQGHGKAVDWYLLGVLFYEMLVGITPYFTTRKEDIFYNIEYGELKIPNFVSKEARELLKRLLERNPSKRLGGGGRDAQEIKEHPYFKDVDWNNIYQKKIKPPTFVNYMDKSIKKYPRPKLFANDDLLIKTGDILEQNMLKGWSFINSDEK